MQSVYSSLYSIMYSDLHSALCSINKYNPSTAKLHLSCPTHLSEELAEEGNDGRPRGELVIEITSIQLPVLTLGHEGTQTIETSVETTHIQ